MIGCKINPYFLILTTLLSGCAALPLESPVIPHPSSRVAASIRSGLQEAVGVIHVHSSYSDGRLPVEEIAAVANRQRLDYLILTDHDTLQAKKDGKERRYGNLLFLVGEEISTSGGHYLAMRLDEEVPKGQDPQWTIETVSAKGGLGFIAHPFWQRRPWKDLNTHGMTGLEIYNPVRDISEHNLAALFFWTVFAGSEASLNRWLGRPAASLELWDRLLKRGERVVGIGGCEAHGLRRFGLHLGPYATLFKFVRTHLLLTELSEEAIYDALESGHAFVAHEMVADGRGFRFTAVAKDEVKGIMGDRVPFEKGLKLYGYLPSPGKMHLIKDGEILLETEGQELWFDLPGPGIYRLEATRKGKPWIYSNPLYVVE